MSAVPDLVFEYPDCSVCEKDSLEYDGDHWWCEDCGATWDRSGTSGESGIEAAGA